MRLILWAVGINGEGSSKVVVNLIKALFKYDLKNQFQIFISCNSTNSAFFIQLKKLKLYLYLFKFIRLKILEYALSIIS